MGFEIEINENTIREIEDIIIPTFAENYLNKVTDIGSIAVCLQAILDEVSRLKFGEMKEKESEDDELYSPRY